MTHPARHRNLARIGRSLSDRDQELLRLLRRSRFATTRQLARFLRSGHATDQSALRQTSRALQQLHEQKYVTTLDRRIGGKRSGSTGLIWALTPLGHRLLDTIDTRATERRYRPEDEPSPAFLEHTLAITETHLTLFNLDASKEIQLIEFEREPACWRRYLSLTGGTAILKPDAFAAIAIGDYRDHYFLEIDCATEALVVIVRKALQFQEYRRTGLEQRTHGVFPAVIWVTPTEDRALRIRKRLAEDPSIAPGLFTAVNIDQFADHILVGPIPTAR